jgi:hypothetical protein
MLTLLSLAPLSICISLLIGLVNHSCNPITIIIFPHSAKDSTSQEVQVQVQVIASGPCPFLCGLAWRFLIFFTFPAVSRSQVTSCCPYLCFLQWVAVKFRLSWNFLTFASCSDLHGVALYLIGWTSSTRTVQRMHQVLLIFGSRGRVMRKWWEHWKVWASDGTCGRWVTSVLLIRVVTRFPTKVKSPGLRARLVLSKS